MNQLCKVLIVDDEILVRQGIKYVLDWEREGFQLVGEASNGQEALELVQSLKPHIVITDIVMPVMDGQELTRIVKRDYPEIEVIVLSSFSEFHYVRSTFQSGVADYILKPKLEAEGLLQVLNKTKDKIPGLVSPDSTDKEALSVDALLSRIISGYEVEPDSDILSHKFPHELFFYLGCDLGLTTISDRQTLDKLKGMIIARLEKQVPNIIHYPVPGEQNTILFLFNLKENQWSQTVQAVRLMSEGLAESEPERRWVLSDGFHEWSKASDVYNNSYLKLLQYRFFLPDKVLLIHEELPTSKTEPDKFNLSHFTEQIKRLQLEEAFTDLRQHVTSLSMHYESDVFEFKSFLGNIIFNVTNQLTHIKTLEEAKYAMFRAIDEAPDVDETIFVLESFLSKVLQYTTNSGGPQASNANMNRLLEYIEDHYAEPLSLTELSKHFHFNPSYLSSLFTSHNKEGFKEHLNKVRTDKAAELLRGDGAPISEISSMVGYGDHSYFCKVFKKYTGLSPSHYRRQYYSQE
ncbi:response regulator transcription factor [Paenibacillus wynnii]|uniref:response regulator transcription factor n=1 Tax=Paenibacillus wynnii TaxID=268407 RepID=UPI00278FAD9D|nr:response regulator transcription factor [Paenibacillus wynnii]MDQ0196357.1 two-component system response regulator YesN [Paenibacillus wynnii]